MNPFQTILTVVIRGYRLVVSPVLGALGAPFGLGCRFTPTCSQYALDAVKAHGAWRGSWLSIRRVCRCHPWGGSGDDPVPATGARKTRTLRTSDVSFPLTLALSPGERETCSTSLPQSNGARRTASAGTPTPYQPSGLPNR